MKAKNKSKITLKCNSMVIEFFNLHVLKRIPTKIICGDHQRFDICFHSQNKIIICLFCFALRIFIFYGETS